MITITCELSYMEFSQQYCYKLKTLETWHCATGQVFPSSFERKQLDNTGTSGENTMSGNWIHLAHDKIWQCMLVNMEINVTELH